MCIPAEYDEDVTLVNYVRSCPKCGTENWVEAPDYFAEKGTHDMDYFVKCRNCRSDVLMWKQDIGLEED